MVKSIKRDVSDVVLYGMTDRLPLVLKISIRADPSVVTNLTEKCHHAGEMISTHLPVTLLKPDCHDIEHHMVHSPLKFWSGKGIETVCELFKLPFRAS